MKNRKKIGSIFCAVIILGLSAALTGCGGGEVQASGRGTGAESDLPRNISMVLGTHQFFPKIALNTDAVYSNVYDACASFGSFSAVVVDGDPFVACNYDIQETEQKVDRAKKKQLATANTQQILTSLSGATAKTPEIDTLSAIDLSADTLHSVTGESEKSMIIYDSGLSTVSLLNFAAQNIIWEAPETIVAQLEELHAIPDLTDIHVIWIGLGATCGDQAKLTESYKYQLQELWEAILTAGNAASVTFDTSPVSTEEADAELPKCTTVPVIADCLEVSATVTEKSMPEAMKFDEKSAVRFLGDQSEFVDPEAAAAALEPVTAYLKANPEEQLYVFGMTATVMGGDQGTALAMERAGACREILLEKGAGEEQLICVGLGQSPNPLRVNDTDEDGRQIEEKAQCNRAVFFVKSDSALVNTLLQCANQGGDK